MSRIHEALKKAEQERALTPPAEVAALPGPSVTVEGNGGTRAVAALTHVHSQSSVTTPPLGDYLRFDDLKLHCAHPHWHPDPKVNLFINSDLSDRGAEQFRTLRSRLYQLRGNQPLRRILITSSLPAEGKTFLANNLAHAMVQQPDCRVLLIDADLRCSRLHVPMGASPTPGLTDYLRGGADDMAVIQHGQEGNLFFIPGGTEVANPSELLSNGRLKMLLDRVMPIFDWVIVDSPPCLPVSDASVLADLCDGVLLVVRAGSTPAAVAQKMYQGLQTKNVVGVVLNAVAEADVPISYYYSRGAYGRDQTSPQKSRE